MLTSAEGLASLVEALEVRFLANRGDNLYFGLLTDFADAPAETTPQDQPLLDWRVSPLKNSTGNIGADASPFFLFIARAPGIPGTRYGWATNANAGSLRR